VVAVASAVVVFHPLGFSAWFDEAYSYGMATRPLRSLFAHWIWGSESNMVLYYLILKAWLGITGLVGIAPGEVVLRLPSALFAVAASVVVYGIGRRLFGTLAGMVAAGLYLANFLQMIVAQMARSYSLELFLLALSWYALVAALDSKSSSRRWWAVFVISGVLSVYAALFSGLVLVSQAVALVALLVMPGPWRDRVRHAAPEALLSFGLAAALVVPIGVDAAVHGGPVWVPPVHFIDVRKFLLFLGGGSHPYEIAVIAAAAAGFLLAIPGLLANRGPFGRLVRARPDTLGGAVAIAAWWVVPLVISFGLTQPGLNLHLFFNRYLVVVVPALCLLAGLGVSLLPWRAAQLAAGVGLVIVAWPQLLLYYQYAQVQDFSDPVRWVEQRYQPGDGLICLPAIQCAIPVEYYLQASRGPAHFDADSPGRFSWDSGRGVPFDAATVLDYTARHRRVFVIFGPLGANDALQAEDKALESTLGDHYQQVGHAAGHGAAVDSAVTLYQVHP